MTMTSMLTDLLGGLLVSVEIFFFTFLFLSLFQFSHNFTKFLFFKGYIIFSNVKLIWFYDIPDKTMNSGYMKQLAIVQTTDNLIGGGIGICNYSHMLPFGT